METMETNAVQVPMHKQPLGPEARVLGLMTQALNTHLPSECHPGRGGHWTLLAPEQASGSPGHPRLQRQGAGPIPAGADAGGGPLLPLPPPTRLPCDFPQIRGENTRALPSHRTLHQNSFQSKVKFNIFLWPVFVTGELSRLPRTAPGPHSREPHTGLQFFKPLPANSNQTL